MTHPGTFTVAEINKMDGVRDITPIAARGKFIQALKAEAVGDHVKAEALLTEAVALTS